MDYTEMSTADFDQAFEEYMEKIYDDLKVGLWYDHEQLLNNDEHTRLNFMEMNLDAFTEYLSRNKDKSTSAIIDNYFLNYGLKLKNDFDYYYTLRILDILLDDETNFTLFDTAFHDEQFIRKSYDVNENIEKYLTTFQKTIYLYDDLFAVSVRNTVKYFKSVKVALFN